MPQKHDEFHDNVQRYGTQVTTLEYSVSRAMLNARRWSVRLLIAGAIFQLFETVFLLGCGYIVILILPASRSGPITMTRITDFVPFSQVLHNALQSPKTVILSFGLALLLALAAWGIRREYGWALWLGLMLSCLLSIALLVPACGDAVIFLISSAQIYMGGTGLTSLNLFSRLYMICFGVVQLAAAFHLWRIVKQRHVAMHKK